MLAYGKIRGNTRIERYFRNTLFHYYDFSVTIVTKHIHTICNRLLSFRGITGLRGSVLIFFGGNFWGTITQELFWL